jgi:hypothetical protein
MSNTSGKNKTKKSEKKNTHVDDLRTMYGPEVDGDSETKTALPYSNIYTSQTKVSDFKVNGNRLVSAMLQIIEKRDKALKRAANSTRASEKEKIVRVAQEELENNLSIVLNVHAVGASAVAKHTKHFADFATIGDESVDAILEEMNEHVKAYSEDYVNMWMTVRVQSIVRASIANHLKAFNAVSSTGGFTYTDLSSCQVLRYYPKEFLDLVTESATRFSTRTMKLPRETRDAIKKLDSADTPVSDKYDSLARDWFAQAPYLGDTNTQDGAAMTTRMVQHILTCMIRHAEIENVAMVYKTCGDRNKLVDQFEVPVFDLNDDDTRELGVSLIDKPDRLFPPKDNGEEGKIDKPPRNVYIINADSILGELIELANTTNRSNVSATWKKMYKHNGRYVYKSSSLSNDLEMRLRGNNVADMSDPLSTAMNQYLNMTNMKTTIENATDKTKALQESPYVLIREGLGGKAADAATFFRYYNQATTIFQALAMLSVACEINRHIYEGKKIYNTKERTLTGRTKKKYADGTKASKRGKKAGDEEEEEDDGSGTSGSDDASSSDDDGEDSE